ncbi:MarP family serine protease [Salininema proteolyticum]|uniref:MarP family serine protease n=1 Tax=Salininema proteolyticum TaxID=1607685 RepID=A0ABV8U3I8_9ACTN
MTGEPRWFVDLVDAIDREKADPDANGLLPAAKRSSGARNAAVLVLLSSEGDGAGPRVLLQERAHHLRHHPGQISFPGGAVEPGDPDAPTAALREAEEELGVKPAGVDIGTELPPLWIPVSGFLVTCVVSHWREPHPVEPVDTGEVAAAHSVSLEDLADPGNRGTVAYPNGRTGPGFEVPGVPLIWGFTGGVLSWLVNTAGLERAWDPDRRFSLDREREIWQNSRTRRLGRSEAGEGRAAMPGETGGLVIDVLIVVLALLFAIHGYRQGFIISGATFVGFLGGAIAGVLLVPFVAQFYQEPTAKLVSALLVIFALALAGQALLTWLGYKLRKRLKNSGSVRLDKIGGPIVSLLAVVLATWLIAAPLAMSAIPQVASSVRHSHLVRVIDENMPPPVRGVYQAMRDELNTSQIPDVFGGLRPTDAPDVPPPDPELQASPVVQEAHASVLKVHGSAPSCSRQIEGSSFVYAPERVVTNAHVVAGTDHVQVESGGRLLDAVVTEFDARTDLAVLYVPGLGAPTLPLADAPAQDGDDTIVVGYPGGGGYTSTAARVRDSRVVTGPDIYDSGSTTREVYQLRAQVISGNSGGPLLGTDGSVVGVVFAAALDDPETGYALTLAESQGIMEEGRSSKSPVETGPCTA